MATGSQMEMRGAQNPWVFGPEATMGERVREIQSAQVWAEVSLCRGQVWTWQVVEEASRKLVTWTVGWVVHTLVKLP